jgi:hypothetical protein
MTAANQVIVATACDEGYARLALGLVRSVRDAERAAGRPAPTPIAVIDLGLASASRERLAEVGATVCSEPVPLPVDRPDLPRPMVQSRVVKAVLPRLLPGYGCYVWLDADAWLQNWWAVEMAVLAARAGGVAAVTEDHRAYRDKYDPSGRVYRWYYTSLVESFGEEVARSLIYRPMFNSGFFAANADSTLWSAWSGHMGLVLANAKQRVGDQAALNRSIYQDRVPVYPLPPYTQWVGSRGLPRLNLKKGKLTEPLLPYQEVGVMHLTRALIGRQVTLATDEGRPVQTPLEYGEFRAALDQIDAPIAPAPSPDGV